MHDLVIRNAVIYDGTGAPPQSGSVAVDNGRIVDIAPSVGAGSETVDADGLALAPGIIDLHTHYDAQITWDPLADPSPAVGVTSVLMGNCGFTIAPCHPAHRDLIMRNLTHVEGMSLDALRAGVHWEFETFPEYMDMLDRRGVGPNVAVYIGHSSVRTFVMGEDANKRAARPHEIAEMRALVAEGLEVGAAGFSTTTFEGHNGENGIPMPSRLADDTEMRALAGALGDVGRGVFMLTKGSDTKMEFLESLADDTGRPVIIAALLHDSTNPDQTFSDLRHIAAAQERSHELYGQVSPCPLTMDFTLKAPYLMESYDAWRPAMEAKGEAVKAVYADPSFRAAMKQAIANPPELRVFSGDWRRINVVEVANPNHAASEGRNIADLAAADGKDPLDWFLDFGLAEGLETAFTAELLNIDESAVQRLLEDTHSLVSLSDAGAHLTFFCEAGYGLHLLGYWARDRGHFKLEDAVHQLTGRPAQVYRIPDRGRLAAGMWADMMLFDPATIGRGPKKRVRDLPGGAARLTVSATGLHGVWVNGTRLVDGDGLKSVDALAGNLPGQVIRNFAA